MYTREARKNKPRAQTSNPVMSQEQAMVCSNVKCGKTSSEPIELTVHAEGSIETYLACPYCFSQVRISDNLKRLSNAPLDALKRSLKETANRIEKNKPSGCSHFRGYLKTRPKGSPIPDECLTCAAIMKCM